MSSRWICGAPLLQFDDRMTHVATLSCLHVPECTHLQQCTSVRGAMRTTVFSLACAIACCDGAASASKKTTLPSILWVVADDLGYTDLSYKGGEFDTPVLDGLVSHPEPPRIIVLVDNLLCILPCLRPFVLCCHFVPVGASSRGEQLSNTSPICNL